MTSAAPALVMAPMVNQSELAFRLLCRQHGKISLCFTPMISSTAFMEHGWYRTQSIQLPCCCTRCSARISALYEGTWREWREDAVIEGDAECQRSLDRPLVAQLCGDDPHTVAECALAIEVLDLADGIDLNLGCPQPTAAKGNYGAFLAEGAPEVAVAIVERLCATLRRLPVSCKVRKLLAGTEATVDFTERLVRAGCRRVSVHGRVWTQGTDGLADWATVRAVRERLWVVERDLGESVSVFSNGNIAHPTDAMRCIEITGADGVMLGEPLLAYPLRWGESFQPATTSRDHGQNAQHCQDAHQGSGQPSRRELESCLVQLGVESCRVASLYLDYATQHPPPLLKMTRYHLINILWLHLSPHRKSSWRFLLPPVFNTVLPDWHRAHTDLVSALQRADDLPAMARVVDRLQRRLDGPPTAQSRQKKSGRHRRR